ncbi:hypothetical protein ANCCEY_11473 [Ancylostoma ceylanicum]|uniref:Uncharacterized protein n=1 Tax=Ancylostoma ceylanicum TaxID=53326 RepID=A0A0D6LBK0_9BILA|nr:hypothetical protein ANCCEY_11473 [Ancylostoma ceylanicum]
MESTTIKTSCQKGDKTDASRTQGNSDISGCARRCSDSEVMKEKLTVYLERSYCIPKIDSLYSENAFICDLILRRRWAGPLKLQILPN